jgi:hypothetical protein
MSSEPIRFFQTERFILRIRLVFPLPGRLRADSKLEKRGIVEGKKRKPDGQKIAGGAEWNAGLFDRWMLIDSNPSDEETGFG